MVWPRMPNPALQTEQTAAETERLWREIAGYVREACILRRQGRHQSAATIFERELPSLIRLWAAASALPAEEAKDRLNRLFSDEQARVESHWIIARFLTEERTADQAVRQLAAFPSVPSPATSAMVFPAIAPRRIPIADVVDMIDAARDLDRAAAGRPLSP